MKKLLLPLFFLGLFAVGTQAQVRLAAKVVEVLDGRTLVLDTSAGRMTARLQYIETPEPEQSLHITVRDHLSSLTSGRTIEFTPGRIVERITIGKAMLGGVDLSAQLIRDGAAWHEPAATSGQPSHEAAEYANNQELARTEKRGVWSVADLKTPWQIRAERQAALDLADRQRRAANPNKVGLSEFQTESRAGPDSQFQAVKNGDGQIGLWADIFTGRGNETYGLHTFADPQGRFTAVFSSPMFMEVSGAKEPFKIEYRLAYFIANVPNRIGSEWYTLYIRSMKDSYRFEKRRNNLVIITDKVRLSVGSPYTGATSNTGFGNHEFFFYKLSRAQVATLAKAGSAQFKIDGISGVAAREALNLFKELEATMK